jgi:hypothetical protein
MKKRKDLDDKHDDKEFGDQISLKKARVIWSVDLHQKFVKAVNRIGFDSKFLIDMLYQVLSKIVNSLKSILPPVIFCKRHFTFLGSLKN